MRRLSARTYLLGLIAVAIVPVWLFVAYLLVSFARSQQQAYHDQAVQLAQQSEAAVDGALREMLVRLDALARTWNGNEAELAKFHADARRLVADTDQDVSIRTAETAQIFNTKMQFGAPLPPTQQIAESQIALLRAGNPAISDVIQTADGPQIAVYRSLKSAGDLLILELSVPARSFAPALHAAAPEGWVVGVGDRNGVYVTRSQRHDEVSGLPGLPEYLAKAVGASGTFTSINQFGDTLLAGYVRSDFSGWLYAANVELKVVQAPFWKSLYSTLGIAALALSASLCLAYVVGKSFTNETNQLVSGALALGAGRAVVPVPSRLSEFSLVSDALVQAESMLRERTQELEAVVATAPVAVWFTYDPAARQVIRNRFAAELMGLPTDGAESRFGRPDHVIATLAYRDGQLVERDERPLSRAMRGEATDNEEYTYVLLNGENRNLLSSARPIKDAKGRIVGAVQISMDITARKHDEEQLKLLAQELDHRVKNNLAIVQSIVQQTLRNAPTLEQGRESLLARLSALSGAHNILTQNAWESANIRDVIEHTIGSQISPERVSLVGPEILLKPAMVLTISLMVHELSTNAIKYGALSSEGGSVRVTWASLGDDRLRIAWAERGGPPASAPSREGFGTRLLRKLAASRGGTMEASYETTGLEITLTLRV